MRGVEYSLGVFAYGHPVGLDAIPRVLQAIWVVDPSTFPVVVAPRTKHEKRIATPDAFRASFLIDPEARVKTSARAPAVAEELRIGEDGSFAVTIATARGAVDVTAMQGRKVIPSSVTWSWSKPELPGVADLKRLLRRLASALEADVGWVTDLETLLDEEVKARRFDIDPSSIVEAIHWLHWFGAERVARMGAERFTRLASAFQVERSEDGSRLVCLQDRPFVGSKDGPTRRRAEELFGFAELVERFPSTGL